MAFKKMKSESDSATLSEIFQGELLYKAPLFQRFFVWADIELNTLWEDIDTVLDESSSSRFLGAIVLKSYQDRSSSRPQGFWIIDGQQRLTTFYILFLACAHCAHKLEADDLAGDYVKSYLLCQQSSVKDEPKLIPTLPDLGQFREILGFIDAFKPKIPGGEYTNKTGALADAFMRCLDEVEKRIQENGAPSRNALKNFVDTIADKIEFVQINLADHHDPNEVFNRLNKGGQPLEVIDLIRNEVFSLFSTDVVQAEKIYKTKWVTFENSFDIGPSKEEQKATIQLRNGYFFPFALIQNSTTKKGQIFSALSEKWRKEIKDKDPDHAAVHIITQLSEHVAPYRAIVLGDKLPNIEKELWSAILRFSRMPSPTVLYPYLMQLINGVLTKTVTQQNAQKCLNVIESFLVRRAFLGLEPTGLHAIFKDLWKKAGSDWKKVTENIQTRTIEFPDDKRFEQSILENDLYHRRLCNYILEEHERSFTKGDVLEKFPPITADHIMPQERKGDWIQIVSKAEHEKLLHTWANLIPLSDKANSEKNTKSWKECRENLETETVFATSKKTAKEYKEWNAGTIKQRANELCKWALTRWPRNKF